MVPFSFLLKKSKLCVKFNFLAINASFFFSPHPQKPTSSVGAGGGESGPKGGDLGGLLFLHVLHTLGLWWSADGDVVRLRGRKQVLPILDGEVGEGSGDKERIVRRWRKQSWTN